jgi:hypothetical protein
VKQVLYKKVGRRYVPVSVSDTEFSSFPDGAHLVVSVPKNYTMYHYNIDPAVAPLVAAGLYVRPAIEDAVHRASERRPARTPITPEQQAAWQQLAEAFGDELATLHGPCIQDIAQAGVDELQRQAEDLLKNPAVRAAYDQFLLVAKLAQQNNSNTVA